MERLTGGCTPEDCTPVGCTPVDCTPVGCTLGSMMAPRCGPSVVAMPSELVHLVSSQRSHNHRLTIRNTKHLLKTRKAYREIELRPIKSLEEENKIPIK